jgi:hypothetical protein
VSQCVAVIVPRANPRRGELQNLVLMYPSENQSLSSKGPKPSQMHLTIAADISQGRHNVSSRNL